jgi:cytochrome o ubiquinol oxidase subunit 2
LSKKGLIITICLVVLAGALVAGAAVYFGSVNVAVLNPQGEVAEKERNLIYFTLALSAVVVLPVFAMLGIFAWKFREGNEKAVYRPDWKSNGRLEVVWWGIPCLIILVLGIVAWRTSHDLDPYRSLDSRVKPISVQVVALQWKWLFIYPEQNIASVNLLEIPEKTPIAFTITADAPMNAFWIPNLGTQVYAMSGMSTTLHLIANSPGDYRGSSSNISGKGFADMAFTARAVSAADFGKWVATSQRSNRRLDTATYEKLAMPGTEATPLIYQLANRKLYDTIIKKYMTPGHDTTRQQPPVDPPLNDKNPDMQHMNHSDMPGMEGM